MYVSTSNLFIGIKYCGHCNPQKEGQQIVQELLQVLPGMKIRKWTDAGCDAILVVSACPIGCASLPETCVPWVSVVVNQVRNWFIPGNHPANELLNALTILRYEFVNANRN